MMPLNRTLSGKGMTLPAREEDLPPLPKKFRWNRDHARWRYVVYKGETVLWAVRNMEGKLCMGVINCEGYTVEREEYDTIVSVLMAKRKLGFERKVV